jgi:uncharacterized SAM-binding protein YcdF (DUF218 family)
MVISFGVSAVWFAFFLGSFLRDRRLLRNGVYLVLALFFAALGILFLIDSVSGQASRLLVIAVLLGIPLTIAVLAVFLVVNGVTMLRREGRRLGNLLSLLAGLGIIGFVVFSVIVQQLDWPPLERGREAMILILTYVSFLFVCFLVYSFVYGRIGFRRRPDFIVVLGSGLRGSRVPPLLASRLDRAQTAYEAEVRKRRAPMLITSGGKGSDEQVAEAKAMADYLIDHGVPADRVLQEDRSTTTFENFTFSHEIMTDRNPKYRSLIVTNNYHVLRAALMARKAKVNGQVIGSPTAAYYWPSATIREFIAILVEHKYLNLIILALIVAHAAIPRV